MILNSALAAFLQTLHIVIFAYTWIIVISALISWVQPNPYNPIVQILRKLTEPVFRLIRRVIPTTFGMIDIAPLVVILALLFLDNFIVRILYTGF